MKSKLVRALMALTAVALALVVVACGSDTSESSKNTAAKKPGGTVRLWVMNNGPDPVADTKRIVAPFEQQTGIKVNVELVGWDVQFDRIRNAAVSGEGPDVTQAGTTQVPFFAALGGFEDLSDRVKDIGGESAYAPGVWKTTQVQGQPGVYGVPWFTEARAIYYRKDALEKAGVDPSSAFTDLNAFRSTLQKLSSVKEIGGKAISPFGGPGKKAYDLVHNIAPWVWDSGGAELSDDASKSTIAEPQSVAGVKFAADLVNSGLWDKSMLERDGQQVEDQFKGGRLAVFIGGPWVLQANKRADDDAWSDAARNNLGVAPMPAGPSGKGYTFVGGSNLMMFKSSKNKDAAWELMKYLSQDDVQTNYADLMGMFPARLSPQEAAGRQDADHEAFYEAIKQGRTYAPIPQWGQIENAYKNRFGAILDSAAGHGGSYSQASIQQQLDAAAKEADQLLAQGG
jgi:multiple sugar transport system substrate-binding protein